HAARGSSQRKRRAEKGPLVIDRNPYVLSTTQMRLLVAALICLAAASTLSAGTLTAAVIGPFSGVAGDPAADPVRRRRRQNRREPGIRSRVHRLLLHQPLQLADAILDLLGI